jgi:uncharacterized protein YkwD
MPIMPPVRRTPQRLLALVLVFAAGLGFMLLPTSHTAHADNVCTPDASWGTVNGSYASQVISLVNQHRASLGLGQLSVDAALSRSAVWKSANMAGLNYFDHTDDPIGRSVADRLAACGWPSNLGWGENIAYGYATPADVMAGWLSSPGHKANIENPAFTSTGVGVVQNAQGVYYWTQDFGQGTSGGAAPPPPPPPPPPPTTTSSPPPPPPGTTTPPPSTTAPPTTTTKPPTTTSSAPSSSPPPAAAPPVTTEETLSVPREPADVAAPAVAKAKKTHKVHKAHRARRTHKSKKAKSGAVANAPRGFLNLHELRHL